MDISISPRRVALILGGIALYLNLHSIVGKHIEYAVGVNNTYFIYNMVKLFNVNREGNIPTWYAATLLLISAVLLALIALIVRRNGDRYLRHWQGLSLLFLYLSIDEAAEVHEKLTIPLQESINPGGYLHFAWLLVGIPVAVGIGLLYLRFIWHLPFGTRRQFVLAGLLYLGGAVGIEAISANRWYIDGGTSLTFSTIGTVEELFEMLGVVVFIYALLGYLNATVGSLRITLGSPQEEP